MEALGSPLGDGVGGSQVSTGGLGREEGRGLHGSAVSCPSVAHSPSKPVRGRSLSVPSVQRGRRCLEPLDKFSVLVRPVATF